MNKILFSATLLACSLTAQAQDVADRFMKIHRTDGTVVTYKIADVDSITFSPTDDTPSPAATDLGEGANTYIVPDAGTYCFETLHVSGKPIQNISHVDWIWCTKSADSETQDYITDIGYANGKVTFTATDKKGDIVIAAFDDSGKIVWTWLLWLTDTPQTMTYENGTTFMDRYLGATSADPADQAATWGLVWQWGRMTPFFAGYDNEWNADEAFDQARKWTVVNSDYDLSWKFQPAATSLEEAIATPLTFYGDSITCDWITPTNMSLWGSKKTDYDPSPAGYRLPMPEQWSELSQMTYDETNVGYTYTFDGNSAWWPASGSGREFDTGCNIIGSACTFVWSACAETTVDILLGDSFDTCWRLIASKGGIYTKAMGNPAFAHSLRCVVDE